MLGHGLTCSIRVVLLQRLQHTAVLIFRTMNHIVRGVVALQTLKHAAVTMAKQMLDHQGIGRVVRSLGNTDMKQAVAGVSMGTVAVVLHVTLESFASAAASGSIRRRA